MEFSFRAYIDLLRPFTLLAPLIVSCCMMIASFFYSNISSGFVESLILVMLPASLSLGILNAASNSLNQATDFDADKLSKPYRPIPRGDLTARQAMIFSMMLYIFSIVISVFIGWVFCLFVLSITFFTLTYSLNPRMKDKLFLNQIWVAVPRGFLGVLASWSVFGNILDSMPLTIGLISMFFLIGGSTTKDISDCEADKIAGTKTLINTFGTRKAAFFSFPFLFFPFAFIPMLVHAGFLVSYQILLTFLAIPSFIIFYLMFNQDNKTKFFENTSSWSLMYLTYFFFAIGFSILIII